MKVQITLNDELMKRADDYAKENYMSRSGLISVALTKYLNESDAVKAVTSMAYSMRKIADTGEVDPAVVEQLQDWERLANLYIGK